VLGAQLGEIDLRWPFWGAALLALCNFAYGWFVLPESLPPERRTPRFDWSHANPLGSLKLLRSYPQVFGLAVVVLLINLAHYVYPSVFVLYADYRYQWGLREVGYVLGVVGVLSVIVNAVLVKRAVAAWGERRALLTGLACGMVGFVIYGLAPEGWMFLAGLPVMAIWAFAMPATQALVTRQVGPDAQGRVQGALSSLGSLAGIAGPAVYTGVFGLFISTRAPLHAPGAPFLLAGAMLLGALLVAWRYARAPRAAPVAQEAEAA
jgi:DHA1 family tetracycline resistance protein-like MFS transporter